MAVRRSDWARLARLAAPLVEAERSAVEHRQEARVAVRFFALVRDLLREAGIDPELTDVPRRLRAAEAELAAIPDSPALRRADQAYLARADTGWIDREWNRRHRYRPPPAPEESGADEIRRLIGRYREREDPPVLAEASPVDLFAWCLSRRGDAEIARFLGPEPPAGPAQPAREFSC
jgi:hypothetical protein